VVFSTCNLTDSGKFQVSTPWFTLCSQCVYIVAKVDNMWFKMLFIDWKLTLDPCVMPLYSSFFVLIGTESDGSGPILGHQFYHLSVLSSS
jgi:hypothetical protein